MNKNNIETTKIKVNNGQELIQKVKEYKNSGGEWKLREKYVEMPSGTIPERQLNWGIIISNGEKEVNICSRGSKRQNGIFDESEVRDQLHQLFPRAAEGLFASDERNNPHGDGIGRPLQSKLDVYTYKNKKETDDKCHLYRYLVAQDFHHLRLIIKDYFEKNEARVVNSNNRNFSGWAEIIDGQDGNMYLYVGEKNENGGREIKIGIKKDEYEKGDDKNGPRSSEYCLEQDWILLIFSSTMSQNPTDKENYYRSLEETFKEQWPHREKLCRKYWEEVIKKMEEKAEYLKEKMQQKEYQKEEGKGNEYLSTLAHIKEIKDELNKNTNIKTCCDNDCPHHLPIKDSPHAPTPTSPKTSGTKKTPNNGNIQIKDSEKSQILSYFLAKKISKISLENDKLIILYNDNTKKVVESEDQQLQKYRQYIKNLPHQSLSLSDLQKNDTNNSSTPDKSNAGIYIGLTAGAFILGGIFVYFLVKKKKK